MASASRRQTEKGRKPSGNHLSILAEIHPGKRSGSLNPLCGKGLYPRKQFFAKSALYVWLGLGPSAAGHRYLAPVELCAFSGARIADIRVKQEHCAGTVSLQTEVRLEQLASSGEYAVCCTLTSPSGDELCVRSVSAEGMATACFVLESPQLWWPNMYGEQPLYALNVELQDKDGQVQDGWHKQIGLRELTVSREPGRMGRGILFPGQWGQDIRHGRGLCARG